MRCATSRTIQSKHDSADIHVTGPLVVRGFESMAVSREHGSYKTVDLDSWRSSSNVTRCWERRRPRLRSQHLRSSFEPLGYQGVPSVTDLD